MQTLKIESEFFCPKATLECGQVFRYKPYLKGYLVFSKDKCCYLYKEGAFTYVECDDATYFKNYFDLARDYKGVYEKVNSFKNSFLTDASNYGKGIRILRQDVVETCFSFIISQNNNILRIKNIIERLCASLGEKYYFKGEECYSFPKVEILACQSLDFYKSLGLGYRDAYVLKFAEKLNGGFNLNALNSLPTLELEKELIKIYGVGKKVADCILLFAFNRTDSFPVDTWIEKLYLENLNGKEKDRNKISKELTLKFGDLSGFIQQYVFYYKRSNN
ncbi:MAG: hypothetical protein J6Q38_05780 [Clostridia bacterium]|nr:hypothetical protein [Clostridia bacterium]